MSKNNKSRVPIKERILGRSIENSVSGCLEWTGCTDSSGYGEITYRYRNYKVHRLMYKLHYGGIPEGMYVCHKCDNPKCLKVEHLFLGTQKDNMTDCARKKRIFAPKGADSPHAKLSIAEVIAIRNDTRCIKQIVQDFKTSPSQVYGIKRRERWAHVVEENTNASG